MFIKSVFLIDIHIFLWGKFRIKRYNKVTMTKNVFYSLDKETLQVYY